MRFARCKSTATAKQSNGSSDGADRARGKGQPNLNSPDSPVRAL